LIVIPIYDTISETRSLPKGKIMEYDQLFKDFLKTFFKNFIALFFPEVHERLNWLEVEFLEKEKFTDIPKGKQRTTDLVVKVATKDGKPEIILVHVEVEGTWRSTFSYRMYEYYALLLLDSLVFLLIKLFFLKEKFDTFTSQTSGVPNCYSA